MGGGVGWLGGRWGVTLYFLSIVESSFAGCIKRRGGLPRCKRYGNSTISRIECWRYKLKRNINLLNTLKNLQFKTEVNELLKFPASKQCSNKMGWVHPTSWTIYTTIESIQSVNSQKGAPFRLSHVFFLYLFSVVSRFWPVFGFIFSTRYLRRNLRI